MKLQELFNTSVEIFWKKNSRNLWIATFSINDKSYEFSAVNDETDDDWNVEFYLENSHTIKNDVTGTGDELVVFSTVLKILDKFIKDKDYPNIEFSAKEPSRKKLYDRMIRTLSSKYGYRLDKTFDYGIKRYRLTSGD